MGSSQSTQRSAPSDVRDNLFWCLDESVHWEEEASIAKLLLSEAAAYRPGQTTIGRPTSMDDATRARAIDLLKTTSEMTYVRIDALLKNGKNKLKDFPASHPARASLASRTFASAATENLAANVDALVVNNPAIFQAATIEHPAGSLGSDQAKHMTTTQANPQYATTTQTNQSAARHSLEPPVTSGTSQTTIPQHIEATVIEGPIDVKGTGTATPPALNATDINAGQAFTPEKLAQQERIELTAKFLFIYSLLSKTTACAQHTYKLNTRHNSLRKALKPKRTNKLDDVTLSRLRESYQHANDTLLLSLANFDRAKSALMWLRRDYEITYAMHRCNELLRSAHKLRDTMTYDDDARASRAVEERIASRSGSVSSGEIHEINAPNTGISGAAVAPTHNPNEDRFYDPRTENRYKNEIADVDRIIDALESRHNKLELQLQENERNALNIAFDYLDASGRGEITHEQCPQLGDRLWRALDTHAHGKITRANMLKGMDNLSKRIDQIHSKIVEIQANSHRKGELAQLQQDFRRDRTILRQLNQFFYQYFVEAVFSDIDSSVREETINITNLQSDIKVLEQALTAAVDPLSSSQASNIGNAGGDNSAAGIVAQHQEVSARVIDSHQQELVKEDRIVAGPTFTKPEAGVPGAIDKENSSYATEIRTGTGGTSIANSASTYNQPTTTTTPTLNSADSTIGTINNSNYVPGQQITSQKTLESTVPTATYQTTRPA